MDIEEMRKEIKDYCYERENCLGCPLPGPGHCYVDASSEEVRENYGKLLSKGFIKGTAKETNKHLNGYIFDSLMYRYQLARERQLMYEIVKEGVEPKTARYRFGSDVIRFREILDEAMGEHD